MAVGLDTTGKFIDTVAVQSISTAALITVGASATDLVVFVCFSGTSGLPTIGSAPTWNSVSMGAAAGVSGTSGNDTAGGGTDSCVAYSLHSPASGAKTFAFSWTGTRTVTVMAISFTGSNGVQNGNFHAGTTNSPSLTITTVSGNATCAVVSDDGGTTINSMTPTQDQSETGGPNTMLNHVLSSGTSNVHSASLGAADNTVMSGLDVIAASAGAAQTPYQPYFQQMLASKRKPVSGWREGYDHRWRRWRRQRGLIVPDKVIRRAA